MVDAFLVGFPIPTDFGNPEFDFKKSLEPHGVHDG